MLTDTKKRTISTVSPFVAVTRNDDTFLKYITHLLIKAIVNNSLIVRGNTQHAVDWQVLELGQDLLLGQLAVLWWGEERDIVKVRIT